MKIWMMTQEFSEGKYLVVRRDGSVPPWPHFVLGGDDPSSPDGLRGYADGAERRGEDPEYVFSIRLLAEAWEKRPPGKADPSAPPHRKDNPAIIRLMRKEGDLTKYAIPNSDLFSEDAADAFEVCTRRGWRAVKMPSGNYGVDLGEGLLFTCPLDATDLDPWEFTFASEAILVVDEWAAKLGETSDSACKPWGRLRDDFKTMPVDEIAAVVEVWMNFLKRMEEKLGVDGAGMAAPRLAERRRVNWTLRDFKPTPMEGSSEEKTISPVNREMNFSKPLEKSSFQKAKERTSKVMERLKEAAILVGGAVEVELTEPLTPVGLDYDGNLVHPDQIAYKGTPGLPNKNNNIHGTGSGMADIPSGGPIGGHYVKSLDEPTPPVPNFWTGGGPPITWNQLKPGDGIRHPVLKAPANQPPETWKPKPYDQGRAEIFKDVAGVPIQSMPMEQPPMKTHGILNADCYPIPESEPVKSKPSPESEMDATKEFERFYREAKAEVPAAIVHLSTENLPPVILEIGVDFLAMAVALHSKIGKLPDFSRALFHLNHCRAIAFDALTEADRKERTKENDNEI